VDALWNGLTITEERKKNITAPYMENHQIIIVEGRLAIKTKADWPARSWAPRKAAAPWTP
jgi:polar amino acid transport system substrate-binding protein